MATTIWKIDPAHTSLELSVKHMMFTTVRGRFNRLEGTIEVDEEDPDRSRVEVEIDASSLDTGVVERDRHLRSPDFLDVERFPKITFRSRRVQGAHLKPGDHFKVVGDLTIRDQTHEIELDATFNGVGPDPWGAERAGFHAETEFDRRTWGLTWNQALETGGILVGNTVHVDAEVEAVKQAGVAQAAA